MSTDSNLFLVILMKQMSVLMERIVPGKEASLSAAFSSILAWGCG
jgi:hypothetical protein